jgi:hypothetical protein
MATGVSLTRKQVSYNQLLAYFLPLALQAFSASFNYPLVAMIAFRGPGGAINHAAMSQAHSTMFFVGTILGSASLPWEWFMVKPAKGFKEY